MQKARLPMTITATQPVEMPFYLSFHTHHMFSLNPRIIADVSQFRFNILFQANVCQLLAYLGYVVAYLCTFLCTLTGLNNAVVYQHWQISGMLRASVADILAVFLSYFPLLYLLWNTADNVSCHWTQEVEPIFEVFYLIDRRSVFVVQIIVSALKVQPITKTSLYQFF